LEKPKHSATFWKKEENVDFLIQAKAFWKQIWPARRE